MRKTLLFAFLCLYGAGALHAQELPKPAVTKDGIVMTPEKNYTEVPLGVEYITITVDPETWYLTLVNKNHRVTRDYVPPSVEIVKGSKRCTLDSRVIEAYTRMYDAALADSVKLVPLSGYRSMEWQETYFNNKTQRHITQDGMTETQALLWTIKGSTYPGASEHNLGFAMDFGFSRVSFAETDQFAWLAANAADYGFIMRFPKEKRTITGVNYEPWHWRYVGVEAAREIKERGICLEEYLGKRFVSVEDAARLKASGVDIAEYLRNQGKKK